MSEKVRKHKERASRLIAKGKLDDAIDELKKAVKLAPRDLTVRQRLAETYARLGNKEEAIREYQSVAGSYAADGLLLKAIAISKVILQIDPRHTETQSTLAELYAQKRGDFSGSVVMPKAMSGALPSAGKRSANEIRGVPATHISRQSGPSAPVRVRPPAVPDDDDVIEVDADEDIEVLSVEAAHAPVSLGAPVQTNLNDLVGLVTGVVAPPVAIDIDMTVEEPSVVVGTPMLPSDEDIFVDDGGEGAADDDGEILELSEPARVEAEELPPIPLFSDLPKEAFIALTERMDLVQAEPGEILIAEGEYASSMYIVIQGRVKVVREVEGGGEIKLAELGDGTFFGEMALLSDAPRTASVIAIEEALLFQISRELVEEITRDHPPVEQVMKRFHRNRLLTNLLRTSPIFAPFSPEDKKHLIEKFKSRHVEAGKLLITRERPGDGLYVLLSGRCEVIAKDEGEREVVIAELKEGDVFGEMSLLFRQTTMASIRTVSPCIVLRLPKKNFDELIMTHPQVLEALAMLSDQRQRYNEELLGSDDDVLVDFLV